MDVFRAWPGEDQDVVKVDESESHDQILVMTSGGVECLLLIISFENRHQVVRISKIQICEVAGNLEKLKLWGDKCERMRVLDGDVIKA